MYHSRGSLHEECRSSAVAGIGGFAEDIAPTLREVEPDVSEQQVVDSVATSLCWGK